MTDPQGSPRAPGTSSRPSAAGRKRRRRFGTAATTPATLDGRTVSRVPRRHLDDAVQQAWLACLRKKNPNTAAASYVNFVHRRESRVTCFSQLDPDEWDRIYYELPE